MKMRSEAEEAILKTEGDTNISEHRSRWQRDNLDEETRGILEEDERYFLHQSLSTPCLNVLKGSKGIHIEDKQGRRYMDFHGNNVHQVGYGNEYVIRAIEEELRTLPFSPRRFTNEKSVKLAKKLTELAPGKLNKVLFSPGATSAIGMALKLARIATGKQNFISLWDSFHGASMDALSVGGEAFFRNKIGALMPGCEHIIPYDSYRPLFGSREDFDLICAKMLDYTLEKQGDVAAVVMETFRNTDVQIVPKRYLKMVREICDKHGALLILDETPIALGRTGRFYAFENYDIVPDMVIIGKGLGGGIFPMAALIAREDLDVARETALGHYTHEKSSVGCAAALATIEYIEENSLLAHVEELSVFAEERIREMKGRFENIGDTRIMGLQFALELVEDRESKRRAYELSERVMYRCLDKGLSFKVSKGNVLTMAPPLVISRGELEQALDILEESIEEVIRESEKNEEQETVSIINTRAADYHRKCERGYDEGLVHLG